MKLKLNYFLQISYETKYHYCAYCGKRMIYPSKDHIIPRSSKIIYNDNIVISCNECNNNKSNLSLLEYLGLLPIYSVTFKSKYAKDRINKIVSQPKGCMS